MTGNGRDELEQLAGEYALGTLAGEERRRFEQRLAADPALRRLVEDWNRRLGPLAEAVPPVDPPPRVWRRIEAGLATAPREERRVRRRWRLQRRLRFWRWYSLGATGVAAMLALYIALGPRPEDTGARYVAVLHDREANPVWLVTAELQARRLTVKAVTDLAAEGNALELWLIPGGGEPPRSLGVLRETAALTRPLSPDLAAALAEAQALAVSLEPAGGSPTGQPTGPVLHQGALLRQNP